VSDLSVPCDAGSATSCRVDEPPETACRVRSLAAWNLRVTSVVTVAASSPAKATRGQLTDITGTICGQDSIA
jgi:hypothetical protein